MNMSMLKGLLLINMFIEAYGFVYPVQMPSLRNRHIQGVNKVSMSLSNSNNDRRDFINKFGKIATVAPTLVLSLRQAVAQEESSDQWTIHKGQFGEDFIKDMVTKKSGLLYKDVSEGTGNVAKDGDMATIQMVGYIYETGEKWTNTYKGIPTSESVLRVGCRENQKYMKGLNEGLLDMKKGGKRVLVIPAYLAYNYLTLFSESNTEVIPGGSSLVCYVELIDVKNP